MLPMSSLRLALGTLLAGDATTLAQAANANVIALIMAPFTPSENMVIGDLTLATFATSTPLAAALNAQQTGINPANGQQVITIKEPAGGWRWVTTAGTNLPQVIYGFALCTQALAALLAIEHFPDPVSLTSVGQEINLGKAQIVFVLEPMS